MKTQLTTRYLLSAILCTLALGSYAWASGDFLEDFSDGDIQDASPVSWQWNPNRGQYEVTPEGLEVRPEASWPLGLDFSLIDEKGGNVHYTGNVTIRAQLNLCGQTTVCGFLGLVTEDYQPGSTQGGYFLGFNTTWLFLSRDSTYCPSNWHFVTTGRFDAQEDVIVQLDVIAITDDGGNRTGSRLECRWWLPGQEMPEQAQIVGTDSVYDVSRVLFGAGSWSADSRMIFRWIKVNGSYAYGDGGFLDDFSDGDIQDGSPVTWGVHPGLGDKGECLVTPEGLQLTPDWPGQKEHPMARFARDASGMNVHYTGNTTIRAQVKMPEETTGTGSTVFLFLRVNLDLYKCYFFCINRQYLGIYRMDGQGIGYSPADWWYPMNGSFDATEDVMIQFDAIDLTDDAGNRTTSRLEVRWWVAGQETPAQPQLAVYDATYDAGGVAIGASSEFEQNRTATFRWVEVIVKEKEVEVEPVVDLNGDEIVDFKDFSMLAEYWYRDDSPFVDRRVDYEYLAVLAEYWLKEVLPDSLLAYWKLDETEGTIAYDSVGENDAFLVGPNWQPAGGKVGGALQFDGVDDFGITDFVLDPADGPFSAFAWVKDGGPGQVILSQAGGRDWLSAETTTGVLVTNLTFGLAPKPLSSQTVITDGDWHLVGVCWDGASLMLYVDGSEVARKAQSSMVGSTGKLYIAAGRNMGAGTFRSGLIDDVRIYNVALSAEEIEELTR